MARALRVASGNYALLSTQYTLAVNEEFEFLVSWTDNSQTNQMILDIYGGSGDFLSVGAGGVVRLRINNVLIDSGSNTLTEGVYQTHKFRRTSTGYEYYVDDALFVSNPQTTATWGLVAFGRAAGNQQAEFDLQYCLVAGVHNWSADASDHSSTILTDTVGGNDASFVGMGTEAWINSGDEPSEGVESSVSLSLDELGFAVTSTVTLPEPSSAANLSLGELTFAVSSTAVLPTPVSAATLQLDELGFTAFAGGTLPTPVSSATLQLESLGFDVAASATQSTPIASIGFSIGELGFDVESAVTLPDVSSSVTMSLSELRFTAVVGEVVASKKYTFSLTPRKLSGALTTRKI